MLSILEYDEEWEKKKLRRTEYEAGLAAGKEEGIKTGMERGITQGEWKNLTTLVCKKLRKGCSAKEIADILEEDPNTIYCICSIAKAYAPDYNTEEVWKICQKSLTDHSL